MEGRMRSVVVSSILALALAGCGNSGLPAGGSGGNSGGGSAGNGGGGTGGSGGGTGGGGTGMKGAPCKTACDCTPGLGCSMGVCGGGTALGYYCCDAGPQSCPPGSACETSTGGSSTCGSGSGGSGGNGGGGNGGSGGGGGSGGFGGTGGFGGFPGLPDGGLKQFCTQLPCQDDKICLALQCGKCNTTTNMCE
jgi:hypothetical protein